MIDKPRELSRCQKQKFEIRSVYTEVISIFGIKLRSDDLSAKIRYKLVKIYSSKTS